MARDLWLCRLPAVPTPPVWKLFTPHWGARCAMAGSADKRVGRRPRVGMSVRREVCRRGAEWREAVALFPLSHAGRLGVAPFRTPLGICVGDVCYPSQGTQSCDNDRFTQQTKSPFWAS